MDHTKTECGRMPNTRAEALCRAGGFLSHYDYARDRGALVICDDLTDRDRALCRQNANIFGVF